MEYNIFCFDINTIRAYSRRDQKVVKFYLSWRAQGFSPALLRGWQRQALEQTLLSSTERDEIKRLRAELKRMEIERDILKKRWPSSHSLSREQALVYQHPISYLNPC